MRERIIALTLTLITVLAIFTTATPALAAAESIALIIDGVAVNDNEAPPSVDNGSTLVPLRCISETLGAKVVWDAASNKATITTAAYTVVFTIGSTSYSVNGKNMALEIAPKIANGRTMVPIRAFSESIGAKVAYAQSTNTATVDYFTTIAGSLKVTGSTTVQPIAQLAADKLMSMNKGISIDVSGGGSGTGKTDAKNGTAHIGMSSSKFSDDEKKEVDVYEIALDGIAIIVHPDNPVISLTKEQAEKIFLGEIVNWNQVGGNNAPIVVMTRETGSGTRATFEELLLEKKPVVDRAQPYSSSQLILNAVAGNKNAIGYDSIGYLDSTVKGVTFEGVDPVPANVAAGKYKLGRSLFVATKTGNALSNESIAKFIDYLTSEYCQENCVLKEGYVKLPR